MPFANVVSLYRDPADVPEEYRKHPSLARLFRKWARDEEGDSTAGRSPRAGIELSSRNATILRGALLV